MKFDDHKIANKIHAIPVAANPMIISDKSTIDLKINK